MLPVSGAWQFIVYLGSQMCALLSSMWDFGKVGFTCAAQYTLPIISAQHEYSRFVNPGLSTKWFVRNRFHSPCAFAFFRSSWMMAGVSHLVLLALS